MRKAPAVLMPYLFVVALMLSVPLVSYSQAQSQNREKFGISAKAGGVNAVTGRATMRPHGNSEWQLLTIKEDLETGDVVRTGLDGRVEMLLNPGSYMRVGENAEFELSDNSLDNLEVRLLKGTAIVEVTGADDAELFIGISTPHARMSIVRRGLYRVNVVPGGTTELIVRKGRVMLDDSHTKVKGGNKVVFSSNSFSVAKLTDEEKKDRDMLAVWSKDRSQALAQANRKITGPTLMAYASSFRDSGWLYGRDSGWLGSTRRGYGLWVFNPAVGYYTFFPYYDTWASPYGPYYSIFLYGGRWGGYYGRPIYRGDIGSGRLGGPGNSPGGFGGPSGSPASDPGTSRIGGSPMGGGSPTSASPMSHGGSERGDRPGNRQP